MSVYAQLPLTDAQIIVEKFESIKKLLNQKGDCNWLSFVRNMINYNNSFGVWYPYRTFKDDYNSLISMQNICFKNPLDKQFVFSDNVDLPEFVKCCQLINSINIDVINDLSFRHPNNKSFINKGPLAYINLHI